MVSKSNRDSLRAGEINESEYRQIVEKSQDIIFTLNPKMEFIYISPSFHRLSFLVCYCRNIIELCTHLFFRSNRIE